MDDFSKRYTLTLLAVAFFGLAWWIFGRDTLGDDINAMLEQDTVLADYPYRFRVISVEEGVATVTSPRSAEVSVMQFLRTAFPDLADMPINHPAMMAAQEKLVSMQSRAADIITTSPDVRTIHWQIDEQWYTRRGVYIDVVR